MSDQAAARPEHSGTESSSADREALVARGRGLARPSLTPRESEVLAHVADGLSHEEIGRRLSSSPETVRTHVRKACERLNARTRTHAVATALRLGLFH